MKEVTTLYPKNFRKSKTIDVESLIFIDITYNGEEYDVIVYEQYNRHKIIKMAYKGIEDVEVAESGGVYFIKYRKNKKWGAIDIDGEVEVPAFYDDVKYIDSELGAGILKKGRRKYYHCVYGEFPSYRICKIYEWLDTDKRVKNIQLNLVEKFYRVELKQDVSINSIKELMTLLTKDISYPKVHKVEKFFERVRRRYIYGEKDCYNYYDILMANIETLGEDINLAEIEKTFVKFGCQVRFPTIIQLEEFIADEKNEVFFVKNFEQIISADCFWLDI